MRSEVLLEVVGFCGDVYHHLKTLYAFKDAEHTNRVTDLTIEDYRKYSRELTVFLISAKIHVKMAIAYGEFDELALFLELSNHFRQVAKILRRATRSGWINEGPQINHLFDKEIDPLRHALQRALIRGTKPSGILLNLFRCYIPTFYKVAVRKKKSN